MFSRRSLLAGLSYILLVFIVAACQLVPAGGVIPASGAPPTAAPASTTSLFDTVVWARIPYCGCLDGKATDNVAAALTRAELAGTVKELNPTGGWMYFVVAYDPAAASVDQIAAAITDGGGEVVAGPP